MPRRSFPSLLLSCLALCAVPALADETANASSGAAPTTLDTIEVKAGVESAQDARQFSAAAKIVVDRAELERLDAATVGELLRQLPGVNLATTGEGGRHGRARQTDRLEPNIVVDGIALPGGNRMAFRLPADLIERIEIIRNSTPEFPSGPGGTINLILRDAPGNKTGNWRAGLVHNDGGPGARVGGTYGDREGEAGLILIGFADTRAITGARRVTRETFGPGGRGDYDLEYDTDSGRDHGVHVVARHTRDLGDGARLVISPFLFGRASDRVSLTRRATYVDPLNALGLVDDGAARDAADDRSLTGRLSVDYKRRRPGQGETSAMLSLQGEASANDRRRDDYAAGGALVATTRTRDTRLGQGVVFRGKQGLAFADGAHLVTLGVDAAHKRALDTRDESVNGVPSALGAQARAESREGELALWAQDEWQLAEAHSLTPGLRVSASTRGVTDASGVEVEDDTLSVLPSLHYLWRFAERWNARASVARAERLPGVNELTPVVRTSGGVNTLSNPDRGGNPALRPETTTSLQLGVEHFLPRQRGSAGLNLYLRAIDDKIQNRTQTEAGRYVMRPLNIVSASEVSVVADFKWHSEALPGLTVRGNVSANRLRLDDAAAPARQESPRRAAALGVDYEFREPGFTFGGNVAYSSAFRLEANPDTSQTQVARTQLDLYALKKFSSRLSLRLSVDNVTGAPGGDDYLETAGAALVLRETERAQGVRVFNLSFEGKF